MYKFLLALFCLVLSNIAQAQTQVPAEDISNYVEVKIPASMKSTLTNSTSVCFKQSTMVTINFNQPTTLSSKSKPLTSDYELSAETPDGESLELPQGTTLAVTTAQINGDIYVVSDETGVKFVGISKNITSLVKDSATLNSLLDQTLAVGGGQSGACFSEVAAMNCAIVQSPAACYAIKSAKFAFCCALSAQEAITDFLDWAL